MQKESLICEAIRACRLLEFAYADHARIVEPYCHGLSKQGVEMLRAVQVGGSSTSGGFGFGKLWRVDAIRELRLLNQHFVPDDPNYNPDDSALPTIHCRVTRPR